MYNFEREVAKVKEYKRALSENVEIVEDWVNKELTYKELSQKYKKSVTYIYQVIKYYTGVDSPVKNRYRRVLDLNTGITYNNLLDIAIQLNIPKERIGRNITGGSKRFIYTNNK